MKERDLTTGGIMNATLSLFFANFMPFFLLVATIHLPELLWQGYLAFGVDPYELTRQKIAQLNLISALIVILLSPIASSVLTYGIFQKIRGKEIDFMECMNVGFGRILPVIGASIVVFIAVFAGCVLLIIPGLVVAGWYYVVIPVVVVEKKGIMESLARSKQLTDGYKKIALSAAVGLGLVVGIINAVFVAVVSIPKSSILSFSMEMFAGIIMQAIFAILPVMTYYMLRRSKENADIEELASLFD